MPFLQAGSCQSICNKMFAIIIKCKSQKTLIKAAPIFLDLL
jgi:hypothetical protein